ncbi:MAG TPA: hypothetical protein VF101_18715 [Gaiellaceae bacterium]
MHRRSKMWIVLAAHLTVAATAAAVALAVAGQSARAKEAYAATHCTHYTPTYSQDYNCYIWQNLTGSGYHDHYHTTGVAKRDDNHFSSQSSSDYWWLGYSPSEASFPSYWGQGYGTGISGTGSSYEYAECSPLYDVTGACWTDWHD